MAARPDFLGRDQQHRRARAALHVAEATYDHPDKHIVVVTTDYLGERKTWPPGLIMCVAQAWIGATTDVIVWEAWSGEPEYIAIPLSRVVSIEPVSATGVLGKEE